MSSIQVFGQRNIRFLVLELPRVAITVADVEADGDATFGVHEGIEFGGAGGDVVGARIGEMEKSVVASAENGEDGLLAKGVWFADVLILCIKSTTKSPRCSGGRENEMTSLMWAGKAVRWWWWPARGERRRLEEGSIFAICPIEQLVV